MYTSSLGSRIHYFEFPHVVDTSVSVASIENAIFAVRRAYKVTPVT